MTTSPGATIRGGISPISTRPSPWRMTYRSDVSERKCQRVVLPGLRRARAMERSGSSGAFDNSRIWHPSMKKYSCEVSIFFMEGFINVYASCLPALRPGETPKMASMWRSMTPLHIRGMPTFLLASPTHLEVSSKRGPLVSMVMRPLSW